MSGHSKWHSIKHKKGAADAKRGKVFTKHARLIAIAARTGDDPDMNAALRTAIDNAKAENVPNDNIKRAIEKGAGTGKDAAIMHEVTYEAYGPDGIGIYVHAITDNKNRTLTNVRTAITKNGGNMGDAGSVAYMFNQKGRFVIDAEGKDMDELQLELIEYGVDEMEVVDGKLEAFCGTSDYGSVRDSLKEAGYKLEESQVTFVPENIVDVTDVDVAKKILRIVDAVEEDDDVSDVYTNFDMSEEIAGQLED
jgi:YebC/PmpR family DNA-binding regulatory protein